MFVKGNDHLSMYAHESSMKLIFGCTLNARTACRALKKIKKFYTKITKTIEYKTSSGGIERGVGPHKWGRRRAGPNDFMFAYYSIQRDLSISILFVFIFLFC